MNFKKIAILNQDSGYLMIDLANAFAEAGYDTTLITGRLVKRNTELNNEIKLFRIVKYKKTNAFNRLYTWMAAFVQMVFISRFRLKDSHLLIVSNPPIASFIPFFIRNTYSLLIYDIYIEILSNILPCRKKSPVSKLWIALHKNSLRKARSIFTLTDGMKSNLERFVKNKSISVVPIWSDDNFLKPIPKQENPFINNNKLAGKFIILYSGNLGLKSDLDTILLAAHKIKDDKILFLIIGEGIGKTALEQSAKKLSLTNVRFMNWQTTNILPYSLASADLAVVTLSSESGHNAIPSKFYNYMAVGSPILSIAPVQSDLTRLIEKHTVGQNFEKERINEIVAFIYNLVGDEKKRSTYSANSLKTAKLFSKENTQIIINNIGIENN